MADAAATRAPRTALALTAVLLLAAGLRLLFLDHNGFGTLYYAAAVRSMAAGWHPFFFASFDPAGFLAIDKPPLAFWLQVASVLLLGYGGLALHLPQVLAGLASVALLHHLVARRFGTGAGVLAALFLALTPISVAVDRSNNTDPWLVLALLLAAWPAILAAERASLRLLLLSAALVGSAFLVKMAAALLVVPAFTALYFFRAPTSWVRRFWHLVAAAGVLSAVGLSWPVAVDLVPQSQRPYVDSTPTNSAVALAVGHNALDRFVRPDWLSPEVRTGAPSVLSLATQVGWLGLLSLAGLVLMRDWSARLLWGGWAATCVAVFSAAGGIFLPYYLAAMGPPLAAAAAIAVVRLAGRPAGWAAVSVLAAGWQAFLAWETAASWGPWVAAAPLAAVALGILLLAGRRTGSAVACAMTGLLVAPILWSLGPALAPGSLTYPSARFPAGDPAQPERAERRLPNRQRLVALLERESPDSRFLFATDSVIEAAAVIVATGRPVMLIGGFSGTTPAIGLDRFRERVAAGEVRHVLVSGAAARAAGPAAILAWVEASGREVPPGAWRPRFADRSDERARRRSAYLERLRLYEVAVP